MHLLPAVVVLELVGVASVLVLSLSSPSLALTSADTITSASSIATGSSNVTCPQCQVVACFGPLSMALWWTLSLSLTLDTVSVLVIQYNNTAVTRTTTINEDFKSVNITTMKEAQSMAFGVLTAIDPEYLANGFILNNGTNAFVDGTFSVAYPTPYVGIQGFEFVSVTQQASQCPKGLQYAGQNLRTAECACLMETYMDDPRRLDNAITSQITLLSTCYELGNPQPVNSNLGTILEGPIPIKNASYSNFIESVLGSEGSTSTGLANFLMWGWVLQH